MIEDKSSQGLIEDLGSISEKSDRVRSRALEIEEDLTDIEEAYDAVISHAEEGLPADHLWQYSPDQITVSDTEVEVTHGLDRIETEELSSDAGSIEMEADNLSEYIDKLVFKVDEKRDVREDFQERIDSVKDLSDTAMEEFLESTRHLQNYDDPGDALEGTWGEKLDQRLSMADGRTETQRVLEDAVVRAEAEEDALENELVDRVNTYVDNAYDRAVEIARQLGGRGRPHSGELDILNTVSRSRATILENALEEDRYEHNSPDVAGQEGVLDRGKEAMETQAYLIAQYASQLDEARDDIHGVVAAAEEVLDSEELEYAHERLEAMEDGYEQFGQAVDDEDYGNLAGAVKASMRKGMSNEEEFEQKSNFEFENLPYLGDGKVAQMR